MKKEQKFGGIKLTGFLYNAIIIASVVVALTSGFRFLQNSRNLNIKINIRAGETK